MKYTIKDFLQKNALQISIQIFGVLMLGLNTYVALKLVPVTERFIKLENRVSATEEKLGDRSPLVGRFIAVEAQVKEMKEQLNRVEAKIDRL